MEPVKIAPTLGGHGSQLLYSTGRQPPSAHPPGTQVIHPPSTRPHDGSPYKGTISPPMVSRGGPYPSYPPLVDGGGGSAGAGPRYIQQPPYISYSRDPPASYSRPIGDRPVILQPPRRPTMIGPYSGYREMMQIIPPSSSQMSSQVESSCKRIKLTPTVKSDVRYPPLVIDTETNHSSRDPPYYPQVEAISPTLPSDTRDESPLHSNTQDVIKQLDSVEKEINVIENKIMGLSKKEKELEVAAQKGDTSLQQKEEDSKEPKHQSSVQVIYAENRKKAEESHAKLLKIIPDSDMSRVLPLYHQPTDNEIYHTNNKKYNSFKQLLLEYFKRKQEAKTNRDQEITQTYSKLMSEWLKKVDKIENSKKHKEKVAKNRELFEKVFPELRKQREDKERFSRVGTRVKSEADMEEIMDGLQEQENEDKKMRAYAVIPPILLDERSRKYRYINKNGLIEDPLSEYKEHKNVNIWNDQESEIFKDRYLLHPKNFVVISSYLERKSASDCIQFYYQSKKKENYKLLVKRRMRRPRANKSSAQAPMEQPLAMTNSTGVTTRGSALKEMQQKNGGPTTIMGYASTPSRSSTPGVSCSSDDQPQMAPSTVSSSSTVCSGVSTCTSITSTVSSPPTSSTTWDANGPSAPPVSQVDSTMVDSTPSKEDIDVSTSAATTTTTSSTASTTVAIATTNISTTFSVSSSEVREKDKENLLVVGDNLVRRERGRKDEDKTKEEIDSSDEEITEHGRGGPHDCVVCKTTLEHYGLSRPVPPGQASQYGLGESTLPPNARVCDPCRCRAVRRKVNSQCPIPTCTTPKWKVKRLRPFPSRWNLLPVALREPIVKELQIPRDVGKSCSACHTRIMRKLGSEAKEPFDASRWSEDDIENLRRVLREVGCHWSRVSERLSNKSASQCRSFFNNMKVKHNLEESVAEYRKSKGKTDPPTVTDEEESGSSTSSCDEAIAPPPPTHPVPHVRHDSASDTASASSPAASSITAEDTKESEIRDAVIKQPKPPTGIVLHSNTGINNKEEYDSSTTASADSPPEVEHIPHPGEKRLPMSAHPKALTSRDLNFEEIIHNNVVEAVSKCTPASRGGKGMLDNEGEIDMATLMNMNYSAPPRSDECEFGLDLTVKKKDRASTPPHPVAAQISAPLSASFNHRGENNTQIRPGLESGHTGESPPKAHSNSISYTNSILNDRGQYIHEFRKSPSSMFIGDVSRSVTPSKSAPPTNIQVSSHLIYTNQPSRQGPAIPPKSTKSNMAPPPPISINSQRLTQIPSIQSSVGGRLPPKHDKPTMSLGSITYGTPVNQPAHGSIPLSQPAQLEMIAKPVLPREGGSITRGTPVHHDSKRPSAPPSVSMSNKDQILDQRRERDAVEIIPRTHVYERDSSFRTSRPPPMGSSSAVAYPFSNYHYSARPPYSDSQISSRQITEDFLTAKQMPFRKGTPTVEKDMRVSPRGRDPSHHGNPRDHRTFPPPHAPPPSHATIDRRTLDPHGRVIDSRPGERPFEHRVESVVEFRQDDKLRKLQLVRTSHGNIPVQSQPSGQHYFIPSDRASRSSASPASVRDATPTPPRDGVQHDFRSPGVSTPTPPPRHNSVIHRSLPSKSTSSHSPHTEPERFSPLPRHGSSIPSSSSESHHQMDNAVVMHRSTSYANMDIRREPRQAYGSSVVNAHEVLKSDNHGKKEQISDSVVHSSNRYNMHDLRQDHRGDKEIHPIELTHSEDKRYDMLDYRINLKGDYRRITAPGKMQKLNDDGDSGKIVVNYPPFESSKPQSPKNSSERGPPIAADFIQTMIEESIVQDSMNRDIRLCRRDPPLPPPAHHSLSISESDKRMNSPATVSFLHKKEKEVVTLEDGPEPNSSHRQQIYKDSQPASIFSHHCHLSKANQQVHIDILSRDYGNDPKKVPSSNHHTISQPPMEITRNQSDHMKIRTSLPSQIYSTEKDLSKDRFDSRSPHRMPTSTASNHIHPNPHGERQIIRIAQPNPSSNEYGGGAVMDIIKSRLMEIYLKDPEISDRRAQENAPPRLSRSGTPIGQPTPHHSPQTHHSQMPPQSQHPSHHPHHPPPHNNPHYDDEHIKKRQRLDIPEGSQRPSRPRSNGPDSKDHLSREEMADSPQSGEMVIDESPRDPQSMMKMPCDMSSRGSASDGPADRQPRQASVYPNSYQGYRLHNSGSLGLPPHSGSWGVSAPPPPITTSGNRFQGYELNVEPVSDED